MKIPYGLSEKKAVVKVNQNNVASVARLCKWLVFNSENKNNNSNNKITHK